VFSGGTPSRSELNVQNDLCRDSFAVHRAGDVEPIDSLGKPLRQRLNIHVSPDHRCLVHFTTANDIEHYRIRWLVVDAINEELLWGATEWHANPKIEKCSMCFDRVRDGKLPACVENCPADALTFGTRRELVAEARRRIYQDPGLYHDHIYGENEAGGTGFLYLSPVPFEELGFNTSVLNRPYPELTRGFLYSVPSIFILWPAILLGIYKATRDNQKKEEENE